jgi:hypothetical protein
MDGLGKAIGCLVLLAVMAGFMAGACVSRCPYRPHVTVERVHP